MSRWAAFITIQPNTKGDGISMSYIIKTESLKHRELFETYYSMGSDRSMAKLGERTGTSMTMIKKYARSFNWTDRVKERDIINGETMSQATNLAMVNSKQMYRETIKSLTDQFIKDVAKGKIKIRNILDFERVVRLDIEFMQMDGADKQDMIDNLGSLASALKGSGFDAVPPPDDEEEV